MRERVKRLFDICINYLVKLLLKKDTNQEFNLLIENRMFGFGENKIVLKKKIV